MAKLTEKQRLFCEYFVALGFNATKAALAAGYAKNSAKSQGSENLTKPVITDHIAKLVKNITKKQGLEVTKETVIRELAGIGYFNQQDVMDENGNYLPIHKWPRQVAAAISSVKYAKNKKGEPVYDKDGNRLIDEIKFHSKNQALENLARHTGVFKDEIVLHHMNFPDLTKSDRHKKLNHYKHIAEKGMKSSIN